MSKVTADRWTLTVEFDSVQELAATGNYEGGLGEAFEFYQFLRESWNGMLEEELDECTDLTGNTVTAAAGVLDHLEEPIRWMLVNTVPKHFTLQREVPR